MFHNWFWGGGMWFGWIFWVAIIGLIIWLVLNQSNRHREEYFPPKTTESPMDILKKRYAKGEISHEEFERMKKNIEG